MNETQIRLKNHEKIVGLREKTYTYLIDHSSADKKTKSTEKWVIKRKLKFEDYKNCFEAAIYIYSCFNISFRKKMKSRR